MANWLDLYAPGENPVFDLYTSGDSTLLALAAPAIAHAESTGNPHGTTAAQVPYTPPGTGVVTRTVEDRLSDMPSAKNFGAVGNDAAADMRGLQRAIDDVWNSGGGTVFVPPGVYRVGNNNPDLAGLALYDGNRNVGSAITPVDFSLVLRPRVSLIGAGPSTVIKMVSTGGGGIYVPSPNGQQIGNLKIEGLGASLVRTIHGIFLCALSSAPEDQIARKLDLFNLWITDVSAYGIGLEACDQYGITGSNILIERTGADGIDHKIRGPNLVCQGVKLSGITVRSHGQRLDGVVADDQAGVNVRGPVQLSDISVYDVGVAGKTRTGIRMEPSFAAGPPPSLVGFSVECNGAGTTYGVNSQIPDARVMAGYVTNPSVGIIASQSATPGAAAPDRQVIDAVQVTGATVRGMSLDAGGSHVIQRPTFASNVVDVFFAAGVTGSRVIDPNPTSASLAFGDAAAGGTTILRVGGGQVAQVPDSTATAGNPRGAGAVDWQTTRSLASQVAGGINATLSGGTNNTVSGQQASCGGGAGNVLSGLSTACPGGTNNVLDATNTWSPGGDRGSVHGQTGSGSWAAGNFTLNGDAQSREFVIRAQTTDATETRLTATNSAPSGTNSVGVTDNGTMRLKLLVVAEQTAGSAGTAGDCATWELDVTIKRRVGVATTAIVSIRAITSAGTVAYPAAGTNIAPDMSDAAASGWRLKIAADTTLGCLAVSGTGENNKTVRWFARVLGGQVRF
ncbi:MAG: hypothetical protein K5Q68_15115 [Roseococcus sp.]|nr:hypothetical protein [Roseococcus sp.]